MLQLAMAQVELAEFEDAKRPLDAGYKSRQPTAVLSTTLACSTTRIKTMRQPLAT